MRKRWPLLLLVGATLFTVVLLIHLHGPRDIRSREKFSKPVVIEEMERDSIPAQEVAELDSLAANALRQSPPDGWIGKHVLREASPATKLVEPTLAEKLSLAATQYVYMGFTEINNKRRGALMTRSDMSRISIAEGGTVDEMEVRSLDSNRCLLAMGEYTYPLFMVDMDYIEASRRNPQGAVSREQERKRRRYYEEMFARPAQAQRGAGVDGLRPQTAEEIEDGKNLYLASVLGPKIAQYSQERSSGANAHSDKALNPNERINYDPLEEPPLHPSQMRQLTEEEYRLALERYWARRWPGRTPLPSGLEPPSPLIELEPGVDITK
jgi:hypothetical protein